MIVTEHSLINWFNGKGLEKYQSTELPGKAKPGERVFPGGGGEGGISSQKKDKIIILQISPDPYRLAPLALAYEPCPSIQNVPAPSSLITIYSIFTTVFLTKTK